MFKDKYLKEFSIAWMFMILPKGRDMLKHKEIKVISIIWGYLILSILTYTIFGVFQFLTSLIPIPELEPRFYKALLMTAYSMSPIFIIFAIIAKKYLLKKKYYKKIIKTKVTSKKVYSISLFLALYFSGSISILALALFLLGKNQSLLVFFALSFISIALVIYNKPSIKEYEAFKKEFEESLEAK